MRVCASMCKCVCVCVIVKLTAQWGGALWLYNRVRLILDSAASSGIFTGLFVSKTANTATLTY